jgi:hypothetical protein
MSKGGGRNVALVKELGNYVALSGGENMRVSVSS